MELNYTVLVKEIFSRRETPPLCCVHSYGCQQNVSDGEKITGMLCRMGCGVTYDMEQADVIILNTCAVRENAELKVYGNVGELKHLKEKKPDMIIGLCGCMAQEPATAEKIKRSYRHVDMVFGTFASKELPRLMYEVLTERKFAVDTAERAEECPEDIPAVRTEKYKAGVSIMYGCNNFCSYCIVPYVRGRERSRKPEKILEEIRALAADGCREIMLLGQNVNSYGRNLEEDINFPELLRRIDALDGDFRVRFMSPHPKDATEELFDVMANSRKICRSIHLPLQSGSNRILKEMNRRYTAEKYMEIVECARKKMPGLSITSDIIVGFPGETREDFEKTLELVRRTKYSALFTFIYSRRSGTAAEKLPDPIPAEEKSRWFRELLDTQGAIGSELLKNYVGKTLRVLAEDEGKTPGTLSCRAEDNTIVEVAAPPEMIGEFLQVRITAAMNWALRGERI